jgi:carotenoid cleavage dioxygenase
MPSRYLEGNFAPVDDEIEAFDLDVDGAIPPALEGRYVRTGPNPIDPSTVEHWFVGDGMLHGVRLRNGTAEWYRNRYVLSPAAAAHKGVPEVGGPSNGMNGSGNTNVVHHAGHIVALTETSVPYDITPELETIARIDFGGPLPAGMTAHPKFDPDTGEMHVMAYFFTEPYLRYHVVDTSGRLVRTEEIDVGGPVMVHDMGLTETKVIVLDLPVVFDMDIAMQGVRLPYRWRDDYQARVGVMPRNGTPSDTTWIEIDPCYVYHPLNAYDAGDSVVMDVVRYETMFKVDVDGPTDSNPRLDRWTIDPVAGKVLSETIDGRSQEFPRADERLATKRHRYGYSTGTVIAELGGGPQNTSAILKHDFDAGATTEHPMGPGRTAGEFVFVPATDDAGEDEGWLMGYVYDAATNKSDLVILDAHDFGADPVAVVHLPRRVPAGFHGNWIPDRTLPATTP